MTGNSLLICVFRLLVASSLVFSPLIAPSARAQTVEIVGSAATTNSVKVPIINDAGQVFYVNSNSYVIGIPGTPIQRTFSSLATILAPSAGDPVPYVLSSNGTVTYVGATALVQSNLAQRINVAVGNGQAAGLGDPLILYARRSFGAAESGVFDYGVAPDDTIAFRAEVSSNGFFGGTFAAYVGSATSFSLVLDSFHSPPGLPGYTMDNSGYFHASRNAQGLSMFIGRAYNNSVSDNGYGIWLHDPVNGTRQAAWASPATGTPLPGVPGVLLSGMEFGINHWPAMDDDGRIAFIGQSLFPTPRYGLYAGFEGSLLPVVTNGLAVPGFPGAYFTNLSGAPPIRMGTGGKLVFVGTIAGAGVTFGVNDKVLVFGSNPADLKILARAGAQAPGMPAGVTWVPLIIDASGKTENIVNYPINDQVVMFGNNRAAFVGQVTGPGIIASGTNTANDSGIWVTDDNGDLVLLTRRGSPLTTTTGTVTPTNYFALQGGSGRDGKPSGGNRLGQLAFANGVTTYRASYPVPLPLALNQPVFVGNQIQLTFATANDGKNYTLRLNTNVTTTNWTTVQTYIGDGATKTNLVTPTNSQGYYQLLRN